MREVSIAVEPFPQVKNVQFLQALTANFAALQSHAAQIVRNEKQARVVGSDGVLHSVFDEGGRHSIQAVDPRRVVVDPRRAG